MKREPGVIAALAAAVALLPPAPPSLLLARLLNRLLAEQADAELMRELRQKTVCIRVTDARLAFFLGADRRGFVARSAGQASDLTIAASARDFLRLALREEDADTLFFARRLCMEGDTELGLRIKNLLDGAALPGATALQRLPQRWRDTVRRMLIS